MGDIRSRLEKLEEQSGYQRMMLACPACGEEFAAHGDVAMEYIVHAWSKGGGGEGHHKTPDDLLRVFGHEHEPEALVEKRSGLPFLDKAVCGMDFGVGQGA